MGDECEHYMHQHRNEKHADHRGIGPYGWILQMTPQQRQRQAARRLPVSWVVATWLILGGMAALVALAIISSAMSAR
jgi:hypothetical protein